MGKTCRPDGRHRTDCTRLTWPSEDHFGKLEERTTLAMKRPKTYTEAIRRHADEVVDEFPDDDLQMLAGELESDADAYEEGSQTAHAIAAELRRRAAAGLRKWSGPKK
jgi:hypothetical protein